MARLLNLFRRRRDRLERDLERELQYHIDRRVDALIADGWREQDARRQARLELGGCERTYAVGDIGRVVTEDLLHGG